MASSDEGPSGARWEAAQALAALAEQVPAAGEAIEAAGMGPAVKATCLSGGSGQGQQLGHTYVLFPDRALATGRVHILGEGKGCASCGAEPAPGHKLSQCSGCKAVRYCGPQCQRRHWGQHKAVCKQLAADAADAPTFSSSVAGHGSDQQAKQRAG